VKRTADPPINPALADPAAAITPEEVKAVRDDAIGPSRSGEQPVLLSVHIPRRAGCGRDSHRRGDDIRGGAGDSG